MARPYGSGRVPLVERLTDRLALTDSGCLEYQGAKDQHGYGRIGLGGREGATVSSHRVTYELFVGPIPDGMHVCHRCDNPPCCHPDHLFLGTPADNMNDKVAKGRARGARGEASPLTPLTEDDVREIRRLYSTGDYTTRSLAARFGIAGPNIWKIVRRITWRHI